ncbi:sulfotransferase family 2 domain-containing protein [Paracoccus alkanivorans]|uniref:Sulfotransferase family protein n=1 Tax=Paracoccus alkanivorans TaxID=2116655 RepID=A0A3M0MBV5_9RHOB|nr:sulfotransferase family 2 domain-containing protein [Paracoccus alkanivorans]RMC33764.1 hypothetical protein C9E81_15805 [Paracoccus alkanivorans]
MTKNVILHLGAHRTGTTGLQVYLHQNDEKLRKSGYDLLYPPRSREVRFDYFKPKGKGAIYSDENIIGYMENNISSSKLYPDAGEKLQRIGHLFDRVERVYISIRNHEDYWKSAISFCIQKSGIDLPSAEQINKIAASKRGWAQVVEDVRAVLPQDVKIYVREFQWKTENPKQQLIAVCKWQALKETSFQRKKHNSGFDQNTLIRTLSERGAYSSADRLSSIDSFELFTERQRREMMELYISDINALSNMNNVQFLSDDIGNIRTSLIDKIEKAQTSLYNEHESGSDQDANHIICFLHIGKTGGTFLKSQISQNEAREKNVILSGHNMTLNKSIEAYGPTRKLAFFFRHPEERFVSAFYSRLRQGRPVYDVNWTAAEAVAFQYFHNPNSLAEALYSEDDRLKSAANFAFKNIFHLALSHEHYLGSVEALLNEDKKQNILLCCETRNIERHWGKIVKTMGFDAGKAIIPSSNKAPQGTAVELSELAKASLAMFWEKEFRIYDTCRKIAQNSGFGDV